MVAMVGFPFRPCLRSVMLDQQGDLPQPFAARLFDFVLQPAALFLALGEVAAQLLLFRPQALQLRLPGYTLRREELDGLLPEVRIGPLEQSLDLLQPPSVLTIGRPRAGDGLEQFGLARTRTRLWWASFSCVKWFNKFSTFSSHGFASSMWSRMKRFRLWMSLTATVWLKTSIALGRTPVVLVNQAWYSG